MEAVCISLIVDDKVLAAGLSNAAARRGVLWTIGSSVEIEQSGLGIEWSRGTAPAMLQSDGFSCRDAPDFNRHLVRNANALFTIP